MISLQYKYTTNSLWTSDAYMRQHNMPTLLQIMACHLFSAKTLSGPMLPYCLLDPKEHFSLTFYFKFKSFHSRKCTWEMSSAKWRPFCLGLNALRMYFPLSSMITMRLWPHDSYWLWRQRQTWTVYDDVIMGAIASQIPSLTIVFYTVYSDADQRKHQSSASLALWRGPVISPHKWPVTRKMFPFDDVIILTDRLVSVSNVSHLVS